MSEQAMINSGFMLYLDKLADEYGDGAEGDTMRRAAATIRALESELSTLKAQRGTAFKAGYHLGHDHTVEGYFRWCDEGSTEVYEDWTAAEEVNSNE